jgi:hypothetical protein
MEGCFSRSGLTAHIGGDSNYGSTYLVARPGDSFTKTKHESLWTVHTEPAQILTYLHYTFCGHTV